LSVSFPTSYRVAMMRSNGGAVATESDDWDLYPIADDSDRKRLARTLNGVVPETQRARAWRGFPSTAVLLAVTAKVISSSFSRLTVHAGLEELNVGFHRSLTRDFH